MAGDKTRESDVVHLLFARRDNYGVTSITHTRGRLYGLILNGKHYRALVVVASFEYYQRRYHLTPFPPDLVVCFLHNTVLPCSCLSLAKGNFAQPYDFPEAITDIAAQRRTQLGSQVLLGMYLCGMRMAQEVLFHLPATTRKRYMRKAKALGRRIRGRPVGKSPI